MLTPFKALVIGDFLLDTYITGKVKRISPEAPVPILQVEKEESRPGGAGNVAVNLVSLGGEVTAVGRIGNDREGEGLKKALAKEGVNVSGLIEEAGYATPVKKRLIASSQQILRVDREKIVPIKKEIEEQIVSQLTRWIGRVQVIAISDYAKGFVSPFLLKKIIEIGVQKKLPVIIDPKGSDFTKYRGATLLKPNLSEAYKAAKMDEEESLDVVAADILLRSEIETLLITRSDAGMSVFEKGGRFDFPVRMKKEVKDVTGAGDTVLAVICAAYANGLPISQAAELANIAAGIAIEHIGCARVTVSELTQRLAEIRTISF